MRLTFLLALALTVGSAQESPPLAVQGAVDTELQPLLEAIGRPTPRTIGGYTFWEGALGERRLIVSRTEVGIAHAAAATALLIREYRPDMVINQGTAGAVNPELDVGDIILGSASVPFGAVRTPHRDQGNGVNLDAWSPLPRQLRRGKDRIPFERFPSDEKLLALAQTIPYQNGRAVVGVVGSADQWNREIDKLAWASKTFGIDSEDMESAAAAQVCRQFDVRFLPVRIISNSEFLGKDFQVETGAICARFVLDLLKALAAEAPAYLPR
jgi:adenosylhomocysteine nucleosidase